MHCSSLCLNPTIFFSLYNFLPFFSQDKDNGNSHSQSSQVRTGKWKVPSSHNYLGLFKGLLDCDQLKVQLCNLSAAAWISHNKKKKLKNGKDVGYSCMYNAHYNFVFYLKTVHVFQNTTNTISAFK